MKAARLHAYFEDLRIEQVPDPAVTSPFDVIVRIGAAGICRTDLHVQEGQFEQTQREAGLALPYVPGHENAGWVESIGDAVTNVRPGDAVILHPLVTCGLCRACRDGQDVHCDNSSFPGLFAEGGFAQYLKTGARSVMKIDDSLHPTDVAALGDAGLTAYHAVKKAVPLLYPGTTCVVIGAGGLGHIGIQCLKAMTPARLVVVEKNERAREMAAELGADETLPVDGDQVKRVLEMTGGKGAEVVIDFVGEAGAQEWGIEMLRRAASYFVVGYGADLVVALGHMVRTEINFVGNLVGTYNELSELMALATSGAVTQHTTLYPLDAVNEAMRDLAEGRLPGSRAILVP
jgi:NAD+-dependent secondary alcohol dehydrogenase Adh1